MQSESAVRAVREAEVRATGTRCGHARVYQATVPPTRPASDYTARVVPQHPGVAVHWNPPEFYGNDDEDAPTQAARSYLGKFRGADVRRLASARGNQKSVEDPQATV